MRERLEWFTTSKGEDILKSWENIQTIVQFDNAVKQLGIELSVLEYQGYEIEKEEKQLLKSLEMNKDLKRILSLNENGIQLEMMDAITDQKRKWEESKLIHEGLKQQKSKLNQREFQAALLAYQLYIVSTFDKKIREKSMYSTNAQSFIPYTLEQHIGKLVSPEEEKRIRETKEFQVAEKGHNAQIFKKYLDELWNLAKKQEKPMIATTKWNQFVVGLIEDGTLPNLLPEARIVQIVEILRKNYCSYYGMRCKEYLSKKDRGEKLSEEFPHNKETEKVYGKTKELRNLSEQIESFLETYPDANLPDTKLFKINESPLEENYLSNYTNLEKQFSKIEEEERIKLETLTSYFVEQDYYNQLRTILNHQSRKRYHTDWKELTAYLNDTILPFLKSCNPQLDYRYQNSTAFYEESYKKEEFQKLKDLLESSKEEDLFQQLDVLRNRQIELASKLGSLNEKELVDKVKRLIFLFKFLYDPEMKRNWIKYFRSIYGSQVKLRKNDYQIIHQYEILEPTLFEEVMASFEDNRDFISICGKGKWYGAEMEKEYQKIIQTFYQKHREELRQLIEEIKTVFPEMKLIRNDQTQEDLPEISQEVAEEGSIILLHPSWVKTKRETLEKEFSKTSKAVAAISEKIENNATKVGCPIELLAKYAKDGNRPNLLEINQQLKMSKSQPYTIYTKILHKMEEKESRIGNEK